jgi:hypothetical protein
LTRHIPLTLILLCALGCDPEPVEEDLRVRFPDASRVEVDVDCGGGCGGTSRLGVEIEYDAEFRPDDETVELLQYRIDYELDGLDEQPPFFADEQGIALTPGDVVSFDVTPAGPAQREFVREQADGESVSGVATITFAGYDYDDAQIFIEADFPIRFSDLNPSEADDAE